MTITAKSAIGCPNNLIPTFRQDEAMSNPALKVISEKMRPVPLRILKRAWFSYQTNMSLAKSV